MVWNRLYDMEIANMILTENHFGLAGKSARNINHLMYISFISLSINPTTFAQKDTISVGSSKTMFRAKLRWPQSARLIF